MATDILERAADKAGAAEDLLRDASRFRSMIADAVDDGVQAAMKTINQGREAAEEALQDAKHAVKRNPMQAMAISFAVGLAVGGLAIWSSRR